MRLAFNLRLAVFWLGGRGRGGERPLCVRDGAKDLKDSAILSAAFISCTFLSQIRFYGRRKTFFLS